MKEATGELNMTVVTLIAVAAVAALFYFFLWPMVQRMVANQTCSTYGTNWTAVKKEAVETGSQATVFKWACCPKNKDGSANEASTSCIFIDDQKKSEENKTEGQ